MSNIAVSTMPEQDIPAAKSTYAIPQPLAGLFNLGIVLIVSQICWYLVFSPNGPLRLYTPNVGLAMVVTTLMVIHWGTDVFKSWPFDAPFFNQVHPLVRGTAMLMTYALAGYVVMFIFYEQVIGRFGPVFFSGSMLLKSGGLGQYAQTATENACFAQITMNTCIIFFTIAWITGFGFKPWDRDNRFAAGLSVGGMGLLGGIMAYMVLFYPHIAYQFYPAQMFMAVEPWWIEWSMTQSSMFHFGWMVPALVLLYWSDMLWEGRPWSLIPNSFLRGAATVIGVCAVAIAIMFWANGMMDWYWDLEAFEGGATLENPAWRWNHVAELAMFMQAVAFMVAHYFDNWPRKLPLALRATLRTVMAVLGGLALAKLYYAIGPTFLGTVPGVGQDGDTSLCWTVMFLILLYAHQRFYKGYPFKRSPSAAQNR